MTLANLSRSTEQAAESVSDKPIYLRTCWECGLAYEAPNADGKFCSKEHKNAFHNRAAVRGATLYHLFMCLRYERGTAKALGVWSDVCKLAAYWRLEDQRERGGRPSWLRAREVIDRHSWILRPVVMLHGFRYRRPEPVRREAS